MTLQQHIDAILSSVFAGELHYIVNPDPDASATYGVWLIVGGESFATLDGDIDLSRPRIQISIYAVDSSTLVTTVAAVKAAMLAANTLTETADPGTNELALYNKKAAEPVDGYEEDTGRYYSFLDYYCWSN
jgi:hypothetical protein